MNRDRRRFENHKQRLEAELDAGENDASRVNSAKPSVVASVDFNSNEIPIVRSESVHSGPINNDSGSGSNIEQVVGECTRAMQSERDGSVDRGGAVDPGIEVSTGYTGEGRSNSSKDSNDTQRQLPSLFPDMFSSVGQPPPLSPPLSPARSTEARDARSCSDAEMETAPGDGDGCDTASDLRGDTHEKCEESTESNEENAFLDLVRHRVKDAKCNSTFFMPAMLGRKDRNNTFNNIVLDRRGKGVPRLLCCTDDVVLTYDTGTGEKDLHFREYLPSYNIGDDLAKCGRQWPQVDRGGIYRDQIHELHAKLTKVMALIRPLI